MTVELFYIPNCKYSIIFQAEGEPIPNVRWYVDKTINEEVFQNKDEELEIMKFSQSESREKTHDSYSIESNPMQLSTSSFPFGTEATSSADMYSLDDGQFLMKLINLRIQVYFYYINIY